MVAAVAILCVVIALTFFAVCKVAGDCSRAEEQQRKILHKKAERKTNKSTNKKSEKTVCMYCGKPVPDGRMICYICEGTIPSKQPECPEARKEESKHRV